MFNLARIAYPIRLWAVLALMAFLAQMSAATLPSGFAEVQVAGGLNPTTMAFAPDGRIFLCEKQGILRLVKNGALVATPVFDISNAVDSWNERGLGSVCVDPAFSTNGWIYVYYTAKSPSSHNRISRFTVSGDTASVASELILLDATNLSTVGWHNGGGLRFGKDGKLYVGTGENANGPNAQDSSNLLGKLLRLNKDGSIPTDNPNYGTLSGTNRAIVAFGLRNPFTIAVQPGSGLLYIGNVGTTYEEIERYETGSVPIGLNYGWPGIDGRRTNQTAPTGYRDPAYAYDHGGGEGTALCGGDFYNPTSPASGAFPSTYTGRYFFCDYRGWIKYIDPANPGVRLDFATNINRPIDVEIAPDGSLWYIARAGTGGGSDADNTATTNGSVWRVTWTGGGGPTKLAFTQQPSSVGTDAPITPAVVVAVQDATGALVTTATTTVTLTIASNPGGAALSGNTSVAAVNGVATFSTLALNRAGTGYTLSASGGGLTSATSTAFTVTSQVTIPAITPSGGSYSGPMWVQLSTPTSGATIRYTTDGTTPNGSSLLYSAPFQITATRTIKAIAQKSGFSDSAIASSTISITGSTPYGLDYRPVVSGVTMPATVTGSLPVTLSGTGLFSNTPSMTTKAGIVPFGVNSALWSDNAVKQRWVALPGTATIGFQPTGEYAWPGGTILIKHFDLVTNEGTGAKRRLETRVLVLDSSGGNGYGVTYRWRSDNQEADLVTSGGQDEDITITAANGTTRTQTWRYPSQSQCLQCHTANAGFVLGPKTRQLNGTYTYPTGRSDNQLRTWSALQMFSSRLDEAAIGTYTKTVSVSDSTATLETRVRSYLDANCSHCHRPNGTGAAWDARFDTPLANQGIINGDVRDTLGITGAKVVVPRDVARSIMHVRMQSTIASQQMPPLARNVVDATAVAAVAQWINSLSAPTGAPISGRTYRLTAQHSGKLLEVPDDGSGTVLAAGTHLVQRGNTGGINQQWRLDDMGGGYWRLTNIRSVKVVDVPGQSTQNSVWLQQYNDTAGNNQRWSLTDVGGGWYTLTGKGSGKNIDVDGASTIDGAQVHQYQSTGASNQHWSFTLVDTGDPVSGAIYTITAKHSGKLMEVVDNGAGGVLQEGTAVVQRGALGTTNQQWRLDDMGGGFWRLTNVRSGKVLDVPGNSANNSVALQQWTDNSGNNQRWSFTDTGGGWFKITGMASGKNLDVAAYSLADGASINQYQDNGQDNQRWMLTMVAPASVGFRAIPERVPVFMSVWNDLTKPMAHWWLP